jgi:hypothetical protein
MFNILNEQFRTVTHLLKVIQMPYPGYEIMMCKNNSNRETMNLDRKKREHSRFCTLYLPKHENDGTK